MGPDPGAAAGAAGLAQSPRRSRRGAHDRPAAPAAFLLIASCCVRNPPSFARRFRVSALREIVLAIAFATHIGRCAMETAAESIGIAERDRDHLQAQSVDLAALYHERWEIETALDELKTHLRGARIVLRSKTPDLVRQEFYGLMMAHFAIRSPIHEAALKADEDPDRLSFLHAVRVVRRKLPAAIAIPPTDEQSLP